MCIEVVCWLLYICLQDISVYDLIDSLIVTVSDGTEHDVPNAGVRGMMTTISSPTPSPTHYYYGDQAVNVV